MIISGDSFTLNWQFSHNSPFLFVSSFPSWDWLLSCCESTTNIGDQKALVFRVLLGISDYISGEVRLPSVGWRPNGAIYVGGCIARLFIPVWSFRTGCKTIFCLSWLTSQIVSPSSPRPISLPRSSQSNMCAAPPKLRSPRAADAAVAGGKFRLGKVRLG